jgi:hypothetical protein
MTTLSATVGGTTSSSGDDRKTPWWSHPTTLALLGLITVLIPLGVAAINALGGSDQAPGSPPASSAPGATRTPPATSSGGTSGQTPPGPSGAPSVLAQGDQDLIVSGQCLDVDTGLPDCAQGSDVEAATGFPCVPDLDPHSGSSLQALGPTSPAQFDALDRDALAGAAFAEDALKGVAVGDAFAVRSADGNVAKVLVESEGSDCGGLQSVTVRFVTYLGPDGVGPSSNPPPAPTVLVQTEPQALAPGQCWDAEAGPGPCGPGADVALVTGNPCVPEIDASGGSTLEYLGPKTTEQFDALGPDRLAVLDYGQDTIKGIGAGEALAVRSADGAVAKARADAVSACGVDQSITLRFVSYQA